MPNSLPSHRLCVAPMMNRTDRHFRYLLRLIAPRAWLYTEMISTRALLNGDARALLEFDPAEQPLALQVGGREPAELARAARMAEDGGYDEININVGCPSGRVQKAAFGAALMREPQRVADAVAAMRAAARIPVTVKTRLGVDTDDSYEFLGKFVASVADAGCRLVIVHARKAWLEGLSPKENRNLPPLDYSRVHRIKSEFPALEIIVNGGIQSQPDAARELEHVDGIMIGRAAYAEPMLIGRLDRTIYSADDCPPSRAEVVLRYMEHLSRELGRGQCLRFMTRHLLGLYARVPGARRWRRELGLLPEGHAGLCRLSALVNELDTGTQSRAEHLAA